jgi:hypothetical protein
MRGYFATLLVVVWLSLSFSALETPNQLWGCWTVRRDLGVPNISGLSQKRINRIIGTRIYYSQECARSGSTLLKSPEYQTSTLSEREFFQYANAPLEKLGIKGTTVTMVELKGADKLRTRFVGSTVFLVGDNPVVETEGVFFELEKTNPQGTKCLCKD